MHQSKFSFKMIAIPALLSLMLMSFLPSTNAYQPGYSNGTFQMGYINAPSSNYSEYGDYSSIITTDCPSANYQQDGGSNGGAEVIRGAPTDDFATSNPNQAFDSFTGWYSNPDYYPYTWPLQMLPPANAQILNVYIKLVFSWPNQYIADYQVQISNSTSNTYPFANWSGWVQPGIGLLGLQTQSTVTHTYDVTSAFVWNASILKAQNTRVEIWFFMQTGDPFHDSRMPLTGGVTHLDYLGIEYQWVYPGTIGLTHTYTDASQTVKPIQEYGGGVTGNLFQYDNRTGSGMHYIMAWDFQSDNYPNQWAKQILPPKDDSQVTITSVDIILKGPTFFKMAAGFFVLSWDLNTSLGNVSNMNTYGTFINSSVYPKSWSIYDEPMRVWNVTNLHNWTITELEHAYKLRILWVFSNGMIAYPDSNLMQIFFEYIGLSYSYIWSGYNQATVSGGINIQGMIWLLIVFLPGIIFNQYIPKFGFTAGIGLMLLIMGLSQFSFLPITILGFIALGVNIYKGS